MDVKIINKNVVPDRIVLYEGDNGSKNLVFSVSKINDGVNVEVLNGYLEVEKEIGVSDKFLLNKTIAEDTIYFTMPIGLTLTNTSDVLSSQIVFENEDKSVSYKSKVFYIDVKYSVDVETPYEQVLPSVITQLETKLTKAVNDCETIVNECEERIKDEVLDEVGGYLVDDEFSLDSENPVQNKIVTEALNSKVTYPTDKAQVTWGTGPYLVALYRKGDSEDSIYYTQEFRITNPYYIYELSANPIPAYKEAGKKFANSDTALAKLKHTIFVAPPQLDYEAANKKYVDDSLSVFSSLHHFVIIPPDTDRTYNFYMLLPGKSDAFNTLAEFIDYIHGLSPVNNVMYFAGTSTEMNFDPSGFTQLKFEMDDLSINIIGIKIDGNYIPKEEVESDTGATLFAFSDTVLW